MIVGNNYSMIPEVKEPGKSPGFGPERDDDDIHGLVDIDIDYS